MHGVDKKQPFGFRGSVRGIEIGAFFQRKVRLSVVESGEGLARRQTPWIRALR